MAGLLTNLEQGRAEAMSEQIYFNYPISLHKNDFLTHTQWVLDRILYYAVYAHSTQLERGSELSKFKEASSYFGVTMGNYSHALEQGKKVFQGASHSKVFTGISKDVYFDYLKNRKTDFDKVCLLAHLSIKSVLGKAVYWKLTNDFWFSRMSGFEETVDPECWNESIVQYSSEYQTKKIKQELIKNWGLVTYSRYTRGFYVSHSLSLEKLIFEAETKRKSRWEKQYKETEKATLNKVLNKIYGGKPP
jgi:hypothetical protein